MARTTDMKLAPRSAQRAVRPAAPRRLPAIFQTGVGYLREVWTELNRVDWPSRRELISSTFIVVFVLVITAAYLGLFDYIYTVAIKRWLLPQ